MAISSTVENNPPSFENSLMGRLRQHCKAYWPVWTGTILVITLPVALSVTLETPDGHIHGTYFRWLYFAAALSSCLMTLSVVLGAAKKKYEQMRADSRYTKGYTLILVTLMFYPILTLIVVFKVFPDEDAMYALALLVLLAAYFIYRGDLIFSRIAHKLWEENEQVRSAKKQTKKSRLTELTRIRDRQEDLELLKEFEQTVKLIDKPALGAVFMTLTLKGICLFLIPICCELLGTRANANSWNTFALGVASGALAVEVWLANCVYCVLFRSGRGPNILDKEQMAEIDNQRNKNKRAVGKRSKTGE